MASKKLSELFNLPFLRSYNTGHRSFITLAKVHTFLGLNFYSRLNSIYTNLIQSIAKKNYKYLSSSLQQNLASKLFKQLQSIQNGRYKFRIRMPGVKIQAQRTKTKILTVRQKIWNNNITRIGIQCKVYFGEKFDKQNPLHFNKQNDNSKVYRIGQFRYVRWYPQLGIFGNIKNMYNQQTYQLFVKYASKMYLQVLNYDEMQKSVKNEGKQQQVISQMRMRTGNQKFDWIITDINDICKKQRIMQAETTKIKINQSKAQTKQKQVK